MATTSPANSPFPTSTSATSGTDSDLGSATGTTVGSSASGMSGGLSGAPSGNGTSSPSTATDMLSRVVQGAHHTIDRLADTAAPAVQRLQDGVHAAGDSLSQRASDAREMGDEWAESLRGTVRDNPLTAVVTALAVGVLIARLTR